MRRLALLIVGTAMALTMFSPASARQEQTEPGIWVNGVNFEGKWAIIGERPYIGAESFANALGLPRITNYKARVLAKKSTGAHSPLDLIVYGPKNQKLPTVRHAGVTMCDLEAACEELGLPFHRNFYTRVWQVGSPYRGEFLKGAWYRFLNQKNGWYEAGVAKPFIEHDDNWWTDEHAEFPGGLNKPDSPWK